MRYSKEDSVDAFRAVTRTTLDYSRGIKNKNIKFTQQERDYSDKSSVYKGQYVVQEEE